MLSSYASRSVISGMRTKGLIGTIKHCFLNEQEAGRQGISTFANERTIREIYAPRLRGHPRWGRRVPRRHGRLQPHAYGGFIIDDALTASEYSSAPEMLMAGNDVFCLDTARPTAIGELIAFTDDGDLLEKVIESNHYLSCVFLQSSMGSLSGDAVVDDSMPWRGLSLGLELALLRWGQTEGWRASAEGASARIQPRLGRWAPRAPGGGPAYPTPPSQSAHATHFWKTPSGQTSRETRCVRTLNGTPRVPARRARPGGPPVALDW